VDLLVDYGYAIRPGGGDREQQFSCDLHGDGRDVKPSARVYPETNSWYCWACSKSRDLIDTVRDKEDLGFMESIDLLEKKFGLSPLPWEDGETYERKTTPKEEILSTLNPQKTFQDDKTRLETFLGTLTAERSSPLKSLLTWWEAFDKIAFWVFKEKISEMDGRLLMTSLRTEIQKRVKEAAECSTK